MTPPPPTLKLHAVTEEDTGLLFAIHRAAFRGMVERIYGGWDETWQRQHFEATFVAAENRIVRLDGLPVGRLVVRVAPADVYLTSIAILPEHQRRGIGTRVLRRLIAEAHRLGRAVRLEVFESNPAHRLYRRLGFAVAEEREGKLHMRLEPAAESTGP